MFQLTQVALEDRFQAWAPNYDQPDGRQTELADIGKIDKVPVYLINAMQDGFCEDDEGVDQMGANIPSFKKKYTLDPFTHMQFQAPAGEQAAQLISYIMDALD